MVNIHLISFAGGALNYKHAAQRFKKNAESSKFFSSINIETEKTLKTDHKNFWETHKEYILNNDRGFGHYLWKPYLISHHLMQIQENDILVYLDIGCVLNHQNLEARNRFGKYILFTLNQGSLAMMLFNGEFGIKNLSEFAWNTSSILDHLNIPLNLREENQVQAGILFILNNTKNREVMEKWYQLCIRNNYEFLNQNVLEKNMDFVSLRFDQSIFSPLYKKNKMFYIPDETYFPDDWFIHGANYPIWAMRLRNGSNPFGNIFLNYYFRLIEFFVN